MSEQKERTVADAVDQNNEQLKQIKDEVGKKYDHSKLTINRVPDESVEKLKQLSYDKFAGDYGLTLAYLLEINELKEDFDKQVGVTNEKVLELQQQVMQLKQMIEEENSTSKDGKVNTIR